MAGKIISFEVPEEMASMLQDAAKSQMLSVSALIRIVLQKYLKEYNNDIQ